MSGRMVRSSPYHPWFHPHINGQQAEEILKSEGVDGTFLVRPSESQPGHFTICALLNNEVTNVKILNDGDCFHLQSLSGMASEPFGSLADLIADCQKKPKSLPLKDGGYIELKYPCASRDPTSERWYHGQIKGTDAEKILLAKGSIGSYLVRESRSQPGQFVLNVRCQSGISHILINSHDGKFDVGTGTQFKDLKDLILFYKEHQQLRDVKNQAMIKLEEPFYSTSFCARNIADRVQQLEKKMNSRNDGFTEEFERLTYLDKKQGAYSTKEGQRPENKTKNRYKNILPYDHSRVKIVDCDSTVPGSDYINANFIDSELEENAMRYIAAQGCLPLTIETFWKMVYQENCRILVMLTNEVERGKAKCARYWPNVGLSAEFGNIIIDNMLEHQKEDFIIRELRLYHKEQGDEPPRMIYHYHFTGWPDHGTPREASAVLDLLDDIYARHLRCHKLGPILYHCSAGIGRTGTVIVIDVLIHLIEEQGLDGEIDIQKTTQLIRTKRPGMIQTQHQYKFVYQAVLHHINRLQDEQQNPKVGSPSAIYENVQSEDRGCMPRLGGRPASTGNANDVTDKSKAGKQKKGGGKHDKRYNSDPGKHAVHR